MGDVYKIQIPKRGFNNIFAKPLEIVNLSTLDQFQDGDTVTVHALLEKGILSKCRYGYKVLGSGKLSKKLTVQASAFSASAKEAIEACLLYTSSSSGQIATMPR